MNDEEDVTSARESRTEAWVFVFITLSTVGCIVFSLWQWWVVHY